MLALEDPDAALAFTVDKTYGYLTYGCLNCCAQTSATMLANPENLPYQGQDTTRCSESAAALTHPPATGI